MITKVALGALVLFSAWVAIMAGVMRFSDAAPAAVVMFPSRDFIANLPDMAVLSQTVFSITLRDDAPDVAARLYAAGAYLVLPAGLTGCLPLPKTFPQNG